MKTNLRIVDFVNETFSLLDGRYKPYKKPNDQLLYVNTSSNHPSQIIKKLPTSTSNCLSNNFSNKQVFDMSKGEYGRAPRESDYKNLEIINSSQPDELLNKRSELIFKCRHANQFSLRNYKTKH